MSTREEEREGSNINCSSPDDGGACGDDTATMTMKDIEISNACVRTTANDDTSVLSCLGGHDALKHGPNRIPPNSIYGRLPRPTSIPTPKKGSGTVVPPHLHDIDARTTYSLLWNGDFRFSLKVTIDEMFLSATAVFCDWSEIESDAPFQEAGKVMGGFTVFMNHDKNQFDFEPIGSPPGLILEIKEQGVSVSRLRLFKIFALVSWNTI
jgi:hypothetical protein